MRRKFKLKVSYTFNGCFTLRAVVLYRPVR